MNSLDMIGIVDALQKRLLDRVDLTNSDYAEIVDNQLQWEALQAFNDELKGLSAQDSLSWLIKRMARLEARVNALSYALYKTEAKSGQAPELRQDVAPVAAPKSADRPAKVVVAMDENVAQDGFYYAERGGDGRSFRWLGPNPVGRVYLPKMKAPLEATLFLAAVYKGVALEAVRVSLNGGPWTPVAKAPAGDRLTVRLVAGPNGGGAAHHLDIDCGATFSPAADGGADARQIGLALFQIELVSL